jgi:hypothetical protein
MMGPEHSHSHSQEAGQREKVFDGGLDGWLVEQGDYSKFVLYVCMYVCVCVCASSEE